MDKNLVRVTDLHDPRRCQGVLPAGQCHFLAVAGSDFCPDCIATRDPSFKSRQLSTYRLTNAQVRERVERHADASSARSLRVEIALIKTILEELANSCTLNGTNEQSLIMRAPTIQSLALTLTKLIKTSTEMEIRLSEFLERSAIVKFAQLVVQTVLEELDGVPNREEIIDRIAERIFPAIDSLTNESQS